MKKLLVLLWLLFTTNLFADVAGLICSDKEGFNLFYLIDVEREKISYTNQLKEDWSSTKLIKSSLTTLKWKEGSIPVWTVSLHRETLQMKKDESSGIISIYQCSVHDRDDTIEGHEKAKAEQRKKNKI